MSKFQPSHLPAVWPWASYSAFLCLCFFNLQIRDDNSVYFMGLPWWLNGSVYVKHWAWHIAHIFAIIAESWGHQTHLNSLNMKSPRLGRVNISVSISQRTPGFSGYSKTEQMGSTDPQQSWMELGPGFLTTPEMPPSDHLFTTWMAWTHRNFSHKETKVPSSGGKKTNCPKGIRSICPPDL